jgi:hypothetical protein
MRTVPREHAPAALFGAAVVDEGSSADGPMSSCLESGLGRLSRLIVKANERLHWP